MSRLCSFDCQEQCEEFYDMEEVEGLSEDLMDRCEVVSLDALRDGGSYRMEDEIIEAEELDWLNDTNRYHNELVNIFEFRKVGVL